MKLISLLCTVLLIFICAPTYAQPIGMVRPLNMPTTLSTPIEQVVLDPYDKDRILFHTGERVYNSRDFAASWDMLFEARGIDEQVVTVAIADDRSDDLFIVTTRKIYAVDPAGSHARVIFEKRGICPLSIATDPFFAGKYIVGTSEGCFISKDAGETWEQVNGFPLNTKAIHVKSHPNALHTAFAVTNEGIYKLDTKINAARSVMSFFNRGAEKVSPLLAQEDGDSVLSDSKAQLIFSLNDDQLIYLMYDGNLYQSRDGGEDWTDLPLPSSVRSLCDEVRLLSSNDGLLLSKNDALWLYSETMQPAFRQLSALPRATTASFDLYEGATDTIVVGRDRSLYYYDLGFEPDISHTSLLIPKYNEVLHGDLEGIPALDDTLPTVRELQEAAIRYALLSTSRMKSWEWRSRLRSIFPQISFGFDQEISNNIDIDRGATSDPDVFLNGPDEEGASFGVSFDWDLAELVWNDVETSVEIRERALVDQRDEILREVTRLYFEHKRLQKERALFIELDPRASIANEIRIEEIRAQLDALTGGYVSAFAGLQPACNTP